MRPWLRIGSVMGQCGCSGDLNIAALASRQKRTLLWVMMINFATFGLMVTGSLLSGSSALLSGTLDNLGDASAYLVSLAVVSASARAKAWAALFKSALIGLAAVAVLGQLLVKGPEPPVPIVGIMAAAALANLIANIACLVLLTPHRGDDVNMASVWECSRNDVFEGVGVLLTAGLVFLTGSTYPDLIVAVILLALFSRSAFTLGRNALSQMRQQPA